LLFPAYKKILTLLNQRNRHQLNSACGRFAYCRVERAVTFLG